MKTVKLDSSIFDNWGRFHKQFAKAMGFPKYYGRNLDAWADCMFDIDSEYEISAQTAIRVEKDEFLTLEIGVKEVMPEHSLQIILGLKDITDFVNQCFVQEKKETHILLNFVIEPEDGVSET